MADPSTVSIVIPAMNEAGAVGQVVRELSALAPWREILVIDDGSSDDTGAEAAAAGARVIRHPYNKGNGAAVKTGIRAAAGEFILIIDADGQHKPEDALRLVRPLGDYDLIVGARSGATQAGAVRRAGNAVLNRVATFLAQRHIPDLTSGFRAARRECVLEFIGLLPNGFSTPTTMTLSFIRAGYSVGFEAIEARSRAGVSKIRLSRDAPKFFLIVIRVMTIFSPLRIFLPISLLAFLTGMGYGIWTIATQRHVTNSSVLLIVLSVLVFLVGLVSEQISAQRPSGRS